MSWKIRRDDERYYVTMDDALAAGDSVILNVQAARIEELEAEVKKLQEKLRNSHRVSPSTLEAMQAIALAKAKGEGK